MTLRPLLVLLTCVVASVSYIGAVTEVALVVMVLPIAVGVGVVAAGLRAHPLASVGTVLLLSGFASEAVNVLSGEYQGSVARSAAVAGLGTGTAVILSGTRRPALFLLPVLAIVAWALALGAGGRVEFVAVATAALALVALTAAERDRRYYVVPPRQMASVLLAVVLLTAAGVFAAHYQLSQVERSAVSPFRDSLATTIEPPAILSLTRHPPPSATQSSPAPEAPSPASANHPRLREVLRDLLWVVVGIAILGSAFLVVRVLWVGLAWRRLRRRLERKVSPPAAGAWMWAVAAHGRVGLAPAPHMSPDVVALPDAPGSPSLKALAAAVAPMVFSTTPTEASVVDVWPQAVDAAREGWRSSSRLRRARARWHGPRGKVAAH
ncbi:MAG: hypothetical protein JWO88_3581 [Frankiales bacterium]|nr:hypothetical protein [Frankiales bacterium]